MKLHGSPTLEPGRVVYVLIHKDQTHVASLPDGSADWSYNRADMELREKIFEKEFKNKAYSVVPLVEAMTLISNKQAELEELWEKPIKQMRRTKDLPTAWGIYVHAKRKLGAHPLRFDAYLKSKFGL